MKIVFFGNGPRAIACLETLLRHGYDVVLAVAHPVAGTDAEGSFARCAEKHGIRLLAPHDPNSEDVVADVSALRTDVAILAGYGKILRQQLIDTFQIMAINMHAGKLPERRGGAPMNWALINGCETFTLSIHELYAGIDSGPVLCERTFPIGPDDTIAHLHAIANENYPEMLVDTLQKLAAGTLQPRTQDVAAMSYYSRRFPDDGLILWDMLSAQEAHNRIRALTLPYPCAYTYYGEQKIALISSSLCKHPHYGDPGRIYQIDAGRLLVCAKDMCLWLNEARYATTGQPLHETVSRYARLSTVSRAVEKWITGQG